MFDHIYLYIMTLNLVPESRSDRPKYKTEMVNNQRLKSIQQIGVKGIEIDPRLPWIDPIETSN